MVYNYDFVICSLVFLSIAVFFYFSKRRLPNIVNRLFTILLITALIIDIMDIISSIFIMNLDIFPVWSALMVNTIYYALLIIMVMCALFYTLSLIGYLQTKKRKLVWIWQIPGTIYLCLLVINLFTGWIFYIEDGMYYWGPLIPIHYFIAGFYLLVMFGYTIICNRRLRLLQAISLISLLVFTGIAVLVQFYNSEILFISASVSAATMMLYLTMQNPSDNIDTLTGSFNKTAFVSLCTGLFDEKRHFYFLGIRINGLKVYNNIFGVENCDGVMRDIAVYLRNLQPNTIHFRITSSTLAIIVYEHETANQMMKQIHQRFRKPWKINGVDVKLTISVSSMEVPRFAGSLESILTNMDYCMMKLDDVNRNSYFIEVDDKVLHEIDHAVAVEEAIERAIENESFEVYYQPIFSVRDNKVTGAESLVRLFDSSLGAIPPDIFIPLAEKNGKILKIGNIVLRKVCEFVSRVDIRSMGIDIIDVNLSVVECMQENICSDILRTLRAYNVPPELIHFEITETAASNSMDNLRRVMEELQAGGSEFSIDDYGTGYANINSIMELPFYMIKLDKSLIWSFGTSERSDIILNHVINMARNLKMQILAEGVETKEQLDMVISKGIDYIQGYYYSMPISEAEFAEYILNCGWKGK